MKNILKLLLPVLFCAGSLELCAQAQRKYCDPTSIVDSAIFVNNPWFGNNSWFKAESKSTVNVTNQRRLGVGGLTRTIFQIPAQYFASANDACVGDSVAIFTPEALINEVNREIYTNSNSGIMVYNAGATKRVCDWFLNNNLAVWNWLSYTVPHNNNDALNIYFVNRFTGAGGIAAPLGTSGFNPKCLMQLDGIDFPQLTNTLAHEIGHCLGLDHTHKSGYLGGLVSNEYANECSQESVDKSRVQGFPCAYMGMDKCAVNGDGLCDTDADAKVTNDLVDIAGCVYTGTDTDNWGDVWHSLGNNNAISNVMSYHEAECARDFTNSQNQVMHYWAEHYVDHFPEPYTRRSRPIEFYKNPHIDVYENDNIFQNASPIEFGVNNRQHHTFHGIPNFDRVLPVVPSYFTDYSYNDVDFVSFTLDAPRTVTIETHPVPGQPDSDTRITLFAATGFGPGAGLNQLDFNDNGGVSTYSRLSGILLPAGSYTIMIQNSPNIGLGHYYISLSRGNTGTGGLGIGLIVGDGIASDGSLPSIACPGEQLGVTGLKPGQTALFSSVPTSVITSTGIINSGFNGFATIKVEIYEGGVVIDEFEWELFIGVLPIPTLKIRTPKPGTTNIACLYLSSVVADVTPAVGVLGYEWEITYHPLGGGPTTVFTTTGEMPDFIGVGTYTVRVRVFNRCGWSPFGILRFHVQQCNGQQRLAFLAPNPAQNQVTVTVKNEIPIAQGGLDIRIKDMYGLEKIAVQSQTRETNIDISSLQVGIYIVYVQNGSRIEYLRLNVE